MKQTIRLWSSLLLLILCCSCTQKPPDNIPSSFPNSVVTDTTSPHSSENVVMIDLSKEPVLDKKTLNIPVPNFLTDEQQLLYRNACQIYADTFAFDTSQIDLKWLEDSIQYKEVEIDGVPYLLAQGRYARWADFDALIHSVFTNTCWNIHNNSDNLTYYVEYDGQLAFFRANKGESTTYNPYFSDEFELVSQTDEEIVFNVIGHYNIERPGSNPEKYNIVLSNGYDYTKEFPIRLVLTDSGWRVDSFYWPADHAGLSDEFPPIFVSLDPREEPPLDERAKTIAVPKFLTQELQELYRRANHMYRLVNGADTSWIEDFDSSRRYEDSGKIVEINGYTYYLACGRYSYWEEFDSIIHSLFTDELWQKINNLDGKRNTYENYEGRMCYINAARGGGYYHRGDVPDEFELISMSKDEIVFNLIGHYEMFPHNDEDVFYTAAFTIRMVRTEDGWRFDKFHDTLADEVSENDPRANFAEQEEVFLLPVYSNTLESGSSDYYYIDEDGILYMWGKPDSGHLVGGTFEDGPRVLMENAAGIYVGTWGTVLAVDKDGTLWGLDDGLTNFSELNPAYKKNKTEGPVWLMDDVAMVSVSYYSHVYILKRDGSLWHWTTGASGFPGFLYGWTDPDNPGKPKGEALTKIMDDVIYTKASGECGWAVTSDGTVWEWSVVEGFVNLHSIIDNGVYVTSGWANSKFAITEEGDLVGWFYESCRDENNQYYYVYHEPELVLTDVIHVDDSFALRTDGTLWNIGKWPEENISLILDGVEHFGLGFSNQLLVKMDDGTIQYVTLDDESLPTAQQIYPGQQFL